MAQAREKGGRVVFIGNIPYGVSEEQICDIFGRAGTVVGFRLVYDKETGKPKGFGFLEYPDADQAANAVRNLNNHEIMGRHLKVDYSNDNSGGKQQQNNEGSNRAPPPAHFDMNVNMGLPQQQMGGAMGMPNGALGAAGNEIPPLPQGVSIPPNITAPDAISKTLQAIPPAQLLDILSQMKTLAATEPAKATAILQQAPQLSYAIFQALLLLGLVDTSILTQLIQQTSQQQPPPPTQQPQHPPQGLPYQQPPPQQYQQQPYSQPPQPAYAQFQQQQQAGPYNPTPPTQHAPYQPPPSQQPVYQQHAPPPQQQQQQPPADQQQQLIQQVLAMTRDQIYSLAEPSRNQIIQLRAQLGHPVS